MSLSTFDANNGFADLVRSYADGLGESEPAWLREQRRRAAQRFADNGLPSKRDEAWKYNSPAEIPFSSLRLAEPLDEHEMSALASAAGLIPLAGDAFVVVTSNGRMLPCDTSELGPGVTIGPISDHISAARKLLEKDRGETANAVADLGRALAVDGVYISVEEGAKIERAIHVVQITTGAPNSELVPMAHPLLLIDAGKESQATVIEEFVSLGGGQHLANPSTRIAIDSSAELTHIRLLREGRSAWNVGRTRADLQTESRYLAWDLHLGGQMTRHELNVNHLGDGSHAEINGLLFGRDEQRRDVRAVVRHDAENCTTREIYKSVLADRSHGIFDGLIKVERDAQRTDAHQTSRNLLLSDDARINSIPRLEIYADDVRCAHGSTTGALDEQQLFYLRTRGYDEAAARATLVYAFASEVLESIPYEPLRALLTEELLDALNQRWLLQEAA